MSERLRALGWFQFQNLVAAALRRKGYEVEPLPREVALTQGIDLLLRKPDRTIAVRCSHGDAWRVGMRLLRHFAEARIAANIPTGLFVSAGGFTDEVYERAGAYRIVPWDAPDVAKLLEDTLVSDDPALVSWFHDERRICPYCVSDLTPDTASGQTQPRPQPGIRCLSCHRFPDCVHTLGIWSENQRIRRFLERAVGEPRPLAPPPPDVVGKVPLTMQMLICPRECAHSRSRFEPTHMVSLQDPGTDVIGLRPPWIAPENHYIGVFCDVRDPGSPEAPQESSIRSVVSWLQLHCGPETTHRFVVHCHAGVGRSPAVGYVAWAIHLGPGREQEAWQRMIDSCVKRSVIPNSLVIGHADSILGRNGALCDPLHRWSLALPWSRFR